MNRNYIPHGYRTVTPYFIASEAEQLIVFLQNVFAAEELHRDIGKNGKVTHAEVRIGDTIIEVSEGNDRFPSRPGTHHLFVADIDESYRRALAAGATSLYEPADMPYGERSAGVEDPFGNHWYMATFVKGEGRGYYD